MPVTLAMIQHCKGYRMGGELADIPGPRIFRFPNDYEKRPITISVTVWKVGSYWGAGGHYHIDINEDDNVIWDANTLQWVKPWNRENDKGIMDTLRQLKGRWDMFTESTNPVEVCEWINKILKEWQITSEHFELRWQFYGTESDDEENQFSDNVKLN
jgi:hypothetical protein